MEELFCHKVHCVNRRLFYLLISVGSSLTCYSLLLLSVLLGANMALSHFCVLFTQEKNHIGFFFQLFSLAKVSILFIVSCHRRTRSSLEVHNSLIYFVHLLKKLKR